MKIAHTSMIIDTLKWFHSSSNGIELSWHREEWNGQQNRWKEFGRAGIFNRVWKHQRSAITNGYHPCWHSTNCFRLREASILYVHHLRGHSLQCQVGCYLLFPMISNGEGVVDIFMELFCAAIIAFPSPRPLYEVPIHPLPECDFVETYPENRGSVSNHSSTKRT